MGSFKFKSNIKSDVSLFLCVCVGGGWILLRSQAFLKPFISGVEPEGKGDSRLLRSFGGKGITTAENIFFQASSGAGGPGSEAPWRSGQSINSTLFLIAKFIVKLGNMFKIVTKGSAGPVPSLEQEEWKSLLNSQDIAWFSV